MKLEMNNSGAWKTIVSFAPSDVEAAKAAAHLLGFLSNDRTPFFRIRDQDRVVASWAYPAGWVQG